MAQNARDVALIPTLGTMFLIFLTPITLVAMTMIMYKLCAVCFLNLPCVCKCKAIACMYVIISIKRLTVPGGRV